MKILTLSSRIITQRSPRVRGFTLIEILVVIGMLAILSTVVLIAVNPLRQFAEARNSQRQNDVGTILNALGERLADNGGSFLQPALTRNDSCVTSLPATSTDIAKIGPDLRPCLVPTYMSELPRDPLNGFNKCTTAGCSGTGENYDLGYTVAQDATTGRITVCAPSAAEPSIASSTSFCLTR
ncbi:prepilin-type N-terminal cleavage/methylation domain-containing protein [Patescibacteria group bacterium]|nr:prepilin-type N-terminal cleavage/methylation domain-containing protein [Patescibacteria group bacterium]